MESYWCWAGSSQSILNYYGTIISQCKFVAYVKTGSETGSCPNQTASTYEAQDGLEHYGVTSTYYNGALSFTSLKSEIGNNRPIYVSIGWLDQNNNVIGGHAVVMDGYYEYTNYDYKEVRYMDPAYGTRKTKEYDSFVFSSGVQKWRWGLKNVQ